MPPQKLTSKNLFDAVFSTIPADVVLDVGPTSVRDRLALQIQEENAAATAGSAPTQSIAAPAPLPHSTSSTFASMQEQRQTRASQGPALPSVKLEVELDEEDVAVQEATKYSEYLTALQAVQEVQSSVPARDGGARAPADDGTPGAHFEGGAEADGASGWQAVARRNLTAEEQLERMPPGQPTLYTGRCATFKGLKGFGFISPDMGGPDVYFTRSSVCYAFTELVLRRYYQRLAVPEETVRELIGVSASRAAEAEREEEEEHGDAGAGSGPGQSRAEALHEVELCKPVPTEEEEAFATTVAQHVNERVAQLLVWQLRHGRPIISVRDRLSFTVHRNRVGRGNSRLLRAEHIRGPSEFHYALPAEQAWFHTAFPRAVGYKAENPQGTATTTKAHDKAEEPTLGAETGGATSKENGHHHHHHHTPLLVRYTGAVRAYDPDEGRGYLRCDEPHALDVLFYESALLWDTASVPPPRQQVRERMRVAYSVSGRDRHNKYVATMITSVDGTLLSPETMQMSEETVRERARGGAVSAGGETAVLGHEETTGDRKRQREDDNVLLFEDDDYAMI